MTFLITGGAGFIGSNFVFYMLKHYPADRVVCLDALTYAGNVNTLASVCENPSFRFVKADICDRDAIDRVFSEEHPDVVINFAAESHVDNSIAGPRSFMQSNLMGTFTLIEAARRHWMLAPGSVRPVTRNAASITSLRMRSMVR